LAWTTGLGGQLQQWLDDRVELPVGALFCVLTGPTRGRAWSPAAARVQLRHTAALAGVRRRFAAHQLRHAHAVEEWRSVMSCRDRGRGFAAAIDGRSAPPAVMIVACAARSGGWWERLQANERGGELAGPGPAGLQAQRGAAGVKGEAAGGVQQRWRSVLGSQVASSRLSEIS
jgi:hypothetical protein